MTLAGRVDNMLKQRRRLEVWEFESPGAHIHAFGIISPTRRMLHYKWKREISLYAVELSIDSDLSKTWLGDWTDWIIAFLCFDSLTRRAPFYKDTRSLLTVLVTCWGRSGLVRESNSPGPEIEIKGYYPLTPYQLSRHASGPSGSQSQFNLTE